MIKAFVFISAILVYICPSYEGLVCYQCYTDAKYGVNYNKMSRCNEANMTASPSITCSDERARCIYAVVESEIRGPEVWRMCSKPGFEPCDPNAMPAGMKLLKCSHCGTDKCNLQEQNTFKISITADVNLSIE